MKKQINIYKIFIQAEAFQLTLLNHVRKVIDKKIPNPIQLNTTKNLSNKKNLTGLINQILFIIIKKIIIKNHDKFSFTGNPVFNELVSG